VPGGEILDAARVIVARSGGAAFTMPEVIAEMHRRGSGHAEATICTMIGAHLCAESTASDSLVARCGTISRVPTLRIAQDPAADELLGRNPLALLLGMLLDQHVRQRSSGG
jgi:hypothetical protein